MDITEIECFKAHVEQVRCDLNAAAQGRPYTLLAATKMQSADCINALPECGIYDYGENRVQEWLEKCGEIEKSLHYHHIGRLQSNKIKYIIDKVMLIHSVDKLQLAKEIDRQAEKVGRKVDILLQVNTANEEQKGGVDPAALMQLYQSCAGLSHVRVTGLMCMAPNTPDERIVRKTFASARTLFDELAVNDPNISILSMGMSHDARIALQEGSTLVRLGTSLFGSRASY